MDNSDEPIPLLGKYPTYLPDITPKALVKNRLYLHQSIYVRAPMYM